VGCQRHHTVEDREENGVSICDSLMDLWDLGGGNMMACGEEVCPIDHHALVAPPPPPRYLFTIHQNVFYSNL